MTFGKFISELRRRNVFKAIIAYLAVAWVMVQISSIVFPAFNFPEYALKVLIYVLTVGLGFWMVFSWIYDWTPDGLQRTEDNVIDHESIRFNNRRLNKVIVGSLTMAVVLLLAISFFAGTRWQSSPPSQTTKKVAVIPLVHEMTANGEDYFKTGLTEELINELSKIDQLKVISQASSKVLYSNIGPVPKHISKELKQLDYLVYGTVERDLNNIDIHLELKKSIDAEPFWQKSYTEDIAQVRPLCAQVARDMARELGVDLRPDDTELWSNLRPVAPETYELYLKGKHYLNKSTREDKQRGLVYLQEAVDRNPADPYAWAGLAMGYVSLGHNVDPPPGVFPKALAAAQRAIQLDSTNAKGWAALSHYHTYFGWDWQLAEHAFFKANALNPNMAWNHYHRSWYLTLFGRMNEAIEEHKLAQELDPFTPAHTAWLGELYRLVGEYEKGIKEAEKAMEMQDKYALGMFIKGRILLDQGKGEEALEIMKQAADINIGWKYLGYGRALIRTGHIQEGKAIIQELESRPPYGHGAYSLGMMYSDLGDFDKAIAAFRHKNKIAWYPWIRVLMSNKEIYKDPRFLELIREMNLPDPAPLVYDLEA